MRHRHWILCLILLIPTMVVGAREVMTDNMCTVDADEVINGVLFALCEELVIDGVVNGDIFGATVRTVINGEVDGSLYMAGGQLDIYGQVSQDVHYVGAVLRVAPPPIDYTTSEDDASVAEMSPMTTRSLKTVTLSTTIYERVTVDDGVINLGYQLIINGDVTDEISFWGSTLVINGLVDGNIYAIVGDPSSESSQIETLLLPLNLDLNLRNPGLIVGENGDIRGLLSYRGPEEGVIDGTLSQTPNYVAPTVVVPTLDEPGTFTIYLQAFGREFGTLLLIGFVALFFLNDFLVYPVANLRGRSFASLAVGLLGFLLSFPIVLIIILLSLALLAFLLIIGFRGVVLAIAIVLGLVNVGGVSIFYFVAIFVTRAIVGLAIGRFMLRVGFRRNDVDEHRWLQYLALVIGIFSVSVVISLPFIGIIMNALALFLGLGAILLATMTQIQRFRESTPTVTPVWYAPSPAVMRNRQFNPDVQQATLPDDSTSSPKMIEMPQRHEDDDKIPPPGTENLPDGFDWDFFED